MTQSDQSNSDPKEPTRLQCNVRGGRTHVGVAGYPETDDHYAPSVQISYYAEGATWTLSGLTPDEARELAGHLVAAAEGAER